jgi:hypothetical protein
VQYLLLIYNQEGVWDSLPKAVQDEGLAAYMAYGEALKKAGALRTNGRLRPTTDATTVRLTNGKPQVLDGPYADTKEQLGGFYIIEAPDLDAAIAWAGRCPGAGHGIMEVRPLWIY